MVGLSTALLDFCGFPYRWQEIPHTPHVYVCNLALRYEDYTFFDP